MSQATAGPAVKAPKLMVAATQLCCSVERWVMRGNAGADQDSTVPSPNEPIVAHSVPGRG